MAKKYYAVKKGKKAGVYLTWAECKAQVDGFSGAVYKSFPTIDEAKKFVDSSLGKAKAKKKDVSTSHALVSDDQRSKAVSDKKVDDNQILAYVDGSYNNAMKVYSGGAVILYKGQRHDLSKVGLESGLVDMRNVAGELLGVMTVINWVKDAGLKNTSIEIHYDYEGIERWANYEWKANKDGTKAYQKFIADFRALGHEVTYVKEKAHSGVYYNEEADRLAGEAIANYRSSGKLSSEKDASTSLDKQAKADTSKKDYQSLFEDTFKKVSDDSAKFIISFAGYDLNEKDMIKFVKQSWKQSGRLIKDIKDLSIELDVEKSMIKWTISDRSDELHVDEFAL